MSICRSATCKENEKNMSTVEKLRYTKTIDSNKVISGKGSFMKNRQNLSGIQKSKDMVTELRRAETNKITNKFKIEAPFKKVENYEKSTFFAENVEANKDGIIRESDIVFDIVHKTGIKDSIQDDQKVSIRSSAQKKWGVILNVFKALKNMKHVNTKHVRSLTELDRTFNSFQKNRDKKKNNISHTVKMDVKKEREDDSFDNNFEEITKQIRLFDYVSAGLEEDLDKIAAIVKNDPMRDRYSEQNKNYYFINQKNSDGFTVLYIACSNGHLNMVELLLKYNADYLQKCGLKEEEQSVLDVAVRWGHIKLVEYLLRHLEWPLEYLKRSLKEAIMSKNAILIKRLKKAMAEYKVKHKKKYCSCFA